MTFNSCTRSIALLLLWLAAGCTKEYSATDDGAASPDAVIQVAVTATECSAITLQGNYRNAIALTGEETITIAVEVIEAGNWSLTTDTQNGFYFSGSGNFNTTGQQQIVLYGAGTPLLPGNYRFSIFGNTTTSFLISVLPRDFTTEPVGSLSYFTATIGGVDYNFEAARQGPDDIPYGSGSVGKDSTGFSSFLAGPGTVSLQKDFIYPFSTSTDADFKQFFSPGAYAYASQGSCNVSVSMPGMRLFWVDPDGNFWSTVKGSANQEGSSFTITGIEDGYNLAGNYYVKVKSRFNCTLYNSVNASTMSLTNGEMVSYFIRPE